MSGKCSSISKLNHVHSLNAPPGNAHLSFGSRYFSVAASHRQQHAVSKSKDALETGSPTKEQTEQGSMSRRLTEMTEEVVMEGGRSARRNIEQAEFSEELKKQLEERIAAGSFKSNYAAAHSIVNMPSSAGQGTRDIAAAAPWAGTERMEDWTLRMLDDSKKKMRVAFEIPRPAPVNFRITPKEKQSAGMRLASARDRTSQYTLSQNTGISDVEREAVRKELRDRFSPGARSMPVTIQGLTSLANERIEDAMARGQFKGIPRGKGVNVQTDHNANSAFIDTTEYFMNKIIKKQEIVPPWIEKQQELAQEIYRFRQRLRSDWRRHAARLISCQGGGLEEQMKRARSYAAAEARLLEKARVQASFQTDQTAEDLVHQQDDGNGDVVADQSSSTATKPAANPAFKIHSEEGLPHLPPLRDPDYLAIERAYHELAVKNLNAIARSYNLQAPPIAQKPYLSLERELSSCYADVAPTLAGEIMRRASEKSHRPTAAIGEKASGIFDSLTTAQTSRVYDEDKSKSYGFKQLWKDLFSTGEEKQAR